MLSFTLSFGAWVVATALPALIGLALIRGLGATVDSRYTAAFGLGIFLWFFVDTIQGSSNLLVNEGFGGGASQVAEVILFAVGLLVLSLADRDLLAPAALDDGISRSVPFLVALAIGVHGLGEGLAFGYTASSSPSSDLLNAFGGVSQGAAYALHKVLEPMIVGVFYTAYSRRTSKSSGRTALDLVSLTAVFVLPSLVGAAVGYYAASDVTYAYCLGAGTAVYAALRLGREVFRPAETPSGYGSLKVAAAMLAGFTLMYLAALMHG